MKNNMLKALQELIKEKSPEETDSSELSHTLTVKGLCVDSSFEIARQNASIAAEQCLSSDVNAMLQVLSTLFAAYQRAPTESLEVLYSTLKDIQNSGAMQKLSHQLNDVAYSTVKSFHETTEVCKRFYPEANELESQAIKATNAKSLKLYCDLWRKMTETQLPQGNFSALDYSKAVSCGDLTDDFVEYPILKLCSLYVSIADSLIQSAIKDVEHALDDTVVCRLMQLLNWRTRFVKICSEPIFVTSKTKRTPILREETVHLLQMHCKWLRKHLLDAFRDLLSDGSSLKEFSKTMQQMQYSYQDNQLVMNLGKKLRKLYGQPKLYENQSEYDRCVERSTIFSQLALDWNQPIEKQLRKLASDVAAVSNVYLALDIPEEATLANLRHCSALELAKPQSPTSASLEQKLLPVNTYIIQRILNLLQSYFIDITSRLQKDDSYKRDQRDVIADPQELLCNLVALAKVTRGFPPKLLNLLHVLLKVQLGDVKDVYHR